MRTTGVSIASEPPLYTQIYLWSCSVALRFPPTWLSLMRVRAAVLRRGALLRKNRQLRHPCAPHLSPVRLHSGSAPIENLGHAPLPPELEIVISAAAAPILNVLPPHSKSGLAMTTDQGKAVAHHECTYIPPTASLNTLGASVILGLADLPFSRFAAQGGRIARSPQEAQNRP